MKTWYVVNVYSGFEHKVIESIIEGAAKKGLEDHFGDMLVPSHQVTQMKKGVKVTEEEKFFPGYILVNMELDDASWHLVKNTQKVSGFLGVKGKPSPISMKEVERILAQVNDTSAQARSTTIFHVGDAVKVCDGPFNTFSGNIEEVDDEKQRIKVTVSIFGRPTPIDLDFTQVEKL